MKTKYCLLAGWSLWGFVSCGEIDETNLKEYLAQVYLSSERYVPNDVYDLGETTYDYAIYFNKSGYYDTSTEVELTYDASMLDKYMETNTPSYTLKVLPEAAASFGSPRMSLDASQTLGKCALQFDINALRHIQDAEVESNVRYVYPICIEVPQDGTALVNESKSYALVNVWVLEPVATLHGKGGLTVQKVDLFRHPDTSDATVSLVMTLPFENKDFQLNFSYSVKPELVDAYNLLYGTDYELIPESSCTLPPLSLEPGQNQATANIVVDVAGLPRMVGGGTYMLPIEVTGSGNDFIPVESGAICYLCIQQVAKYTGQWTLAIGSTESGVSTTPGTSLTSQLFSFADGKIYKPFQISGGTEGDFYKVMENDASLDGVRKELIICSGWAGTMFEQASPVVYVTNEDYGNGLKKVEVISGMAGGMTYDPARGVTDNSSWYNPATNELHLEYSGTSPWGSWYKFDRTYSSQVVLENY